MADEMTEVSTDDEESIVLKIKEKERLTVETKTTLQRTNITDKASALAEMSYASGIMIGPVVGGVLNDLRGF